MPSAAPTPRQRAWPDPVRPPVLDAAEAALLDRIPADAGVVLLVGAGGRPLGRAFRRRNPAAQVLVLESSAAELDRDPEPFAAHVARGGVDCIVYGEVLDRVADPAALLRCHAAWLAETGVVVVALPNPEHWRRVEQILRGSAGFAGGAGLSANAVERALGRAGLHIADVAALDADRDGAEAFADALAPGLQRLGVDADGFARRTAPGRFVWRARQRPRQPIHIVSTMLNPVGGVSHVRVVEPMRALAGDPDTATAIVGPLEAPPPGVTGPKIFILHRPILAGAAGLARLRGLLDDGWLVVCEFDDNPNEIANLRRSDLLNFTGVHAVQTSTAPLADVLRARNPETAVFANAVAEMPDAGNYADPERMTLLCAGLNRERESRPFVDAFNAVAAQAGRRLHFRIVGDLPLFEALQTPHKNFTPICGYDSYRALLARSEISFMPLRDTPFNRCKSDLKFLEAAAHRVTALASPVVYGNSIDDGRTGLIFANPAELEHKLGLLVANPDFGRGIAETARRHVAEQRMLSAQIAARLAWYRALWARKEELDRALLARVPALRPG